MENRYRCYVMVENGYLEPIRVVLDRLDIEMVNLAIDHIDALVGDHADRCLLVDDCNLERFIEIWSFEKMVEFRLSLIAFDTAVKKEETVERLLSGIGQLRGIQLAAVVGKRCFEAGLSACMAGLKAARRREDLLDKQALELEVLQSELAEKRVELEAVSALDVVTGLFNHHYFHENFKREYRQLVREGSHLGMLLVVVDTGCIEDPALFYDEGFLYRQVGMALLRNLLRPVDMVAHAGQGVFHILLPRVDAEGARRVCKRLIDAVNEVVREYLAGKRFAGLTVRAGGAVLPAVRGNQPEALVHLARRALDLVGREPVILGDANTPQD